MKANKDGGTSVGFSKDERIEFINRSWDATSKVFNDILNKECEHELLPNHGNDLLEKTIGESWEKINRELDGVNPLAYRLGYRDCFGRFCRSNKIDFKIPENLSQINIQAWEDIAQQFYKFTNIYSINQQFFEFLNWLKTNYNAPEKK